MDIFEEFGYSDELETAGVWSEFPGGAAILVARFGNENHQQLMVELRSKHKAELDAETPEAKRLSRRLLIQTMVETLLLGWRGMVYGGKPMEYTKANAAKALEHRAFREAVLAKAFDNEAYRANLLEEDTKNSPPPSNGT